MALSVLEIEIEHMTARLAMEREKYNAALVNLDSKRVTRSNGESLRMEREALQLEDKRLLKEEEYLDLLLMSFNAVEENFKEHPDCADDSNT